MNENDKDFKGGFTNAATATATAAAQAFKVTTSTATVAPCAHDKGWNSYLDKGEFVFVCSHCGAKQEAK